MEKAKLVQLDGVTNGFAIYQFSTSEFIKGNVIRDEHEKVIHRDDNAKKLFKNLDSARAYLMSKGINNPYDYKIWIFLDDVEIDFDNVEPQENYYESYQEGIHYYIQPESKEKVLKIGYFIFEDGDNRKTDSKAGSSRCNELYHYIRNAMNDIVKFPETNPTIDKIAKDKNGHMTGYVKGTTVKIHILYNSQIMDINMERKDRGIRCIPYEKSMDKFKTIYMYATKDFNDYSSANNEDIIVKLQELILEYLQFNYPETNPRFSTVEFKGVITD